MKKSSKVKIKLILFGAITTIWIIFGIIILRIFELKGLGWAILFTIIFAFPFAIFFAKAKWMYEEYSDLKFKEESNKKLKDKN